MKNIKLWLVTLAVGFTSVAFATESQVVYAPDSLSGELKVYAADFDGAEHSWTFAVPQNKPIKVTRINSTYLFYGAPRQMHLYVNAATDLINNDTPYAYNIGVFEDTIQNVADLTFVISNFVQPYSYTPKDPPITVRFAVLNEHPTTETTYLNGNVEVASGSLFTSGYQDFMGAKVTAVLGDDYNHYTCFGSSRGGMIRGSNEGYLVLSGNPNGYSNKNVYINRYTSGADVIMTASTGRVGIGVDFPKAKLHLGGAIRGHAINDQLEIETDSGSVFIGSLDKQTAGFSTNCTNFVFDKPLYNQAGVFGASTGTLTLQTNHQPRLTIAQNGYVGVGSTSPECRLDVKGTTRLDVLYLSPSLQSPEICLNPHGICYFETDHAIGIGTSHPMYDLDVNGTIRANEVLIDIPTGADYVFGEDYPLMPLDQLSSFIENHQHLPNIQPATQMQSEGVSVSDMQILLLQKVEELTLYILQQQQTINALQEEVQQLKEKE